MLEISVDVFMKLLAAVYLFVVLNTSLTTTVG